VNHKRDDPPTFGRSKLQTAMGEPGDELVGEWPREQLVRMDMRFCARLERAIARGKEHPKGEQGT